MTDPSTSIAGDAGAPNLAVDIVPDVEAMTFVWDVSEFDSADLLGWGDGTEGWLNIICDVTQVRIQRGATRLQGVLTRTEAGSMQVTLLDTDRQFDPTLNGEIVHPGTPIRVRAWGVVNPFDETIDGGSPTSAYPETVDGGTQTAAPGAELITGGGTEDAQYWSEVLFTGRIGSGAGGINVSYQKSGPPVVTVQAVDRVGPLASWQAVGRPNPGVGAGDDLLQRVGRILEEMAWPADVVSDDVDLEYAATLASHVLDTAWPMLGDATDAELGRLWVDRNDRIVVRSRDSELSGPVRGTLSDVHGEIVAGTVHCCYDDAQVVYGTELLANRAIAGRRIPQPADGTEVVSVPATIVQVDDEYSQARYGVAVVEERSLELATDDQLLPWAQAVVLDATEPELRVDSVSVAAYNAPEAWQQVAATDIGDRWSFRLRPDLGPAVARTLGVLGIEHTITPQDWTCEWLTVTALSPGEDNPSGWFTFDLSDWDGDDLLAPIGGSVLS